MQALQEFVDTFTYLGVFAVLLLGSLGLPIPEDADHRGRRVEPRGDRALVAGLARLPAGGPLRRHGALLGRPALGRAGPQPATGPPGAVARARAVAEGGVSTACPEDGGHGASRHGTARRRVSDRGHRARAVLEVRGGGRGRGPARSPAGLRAGLLLHGSDQGHHGRCAPGRALARSRRAPGAGGDPGRRRVAVASSRWAGAPDREPRTPAWTPSTPS